MKNRIIILTILASIFLTAGCSTIRESSQKKYISIDQPMVRWDFNAVTVEDLHGAYTYLSIRGNGLQYVNSVEFIFGENSQKRSALEIVEKHEDLIKAKYLTNRTVMSPPLYLELIATDHSRVQRPIREIDKAPLQNTFPINGAD